MATDSHIMPTLFLGHGSPMNAVEDNAFTRTWERLGRDLPRPRAIVCISAHWETRGTFVTAMNPPRTIHDFSGFPAELYEIQYPAPGDPDLARTIQSRVQDAGIGLDTAWGLDHGAWSLLVRMYPEADIPVVQLSLDRALTPHQHYDLGRRLKFLRRDGVLVLASGNIVHNLGVIDFSPDAEPFDWALEFDTRIAMLLDKADHQGVIDYAALGDAARNAAPTPEHFLPLIYTIALQEPGERATFPVEGVVFGSISMRGVLIR